MEKCNIGEYDCNSRGAYEFRKFFREIKPDKDGRAKHELESTFLTELNKRLSEGKSLTVIQPVLFAQDGRISCFKGKYELGEASEQAIKQEIVYGVFLRQLLRSNTACGEDWYHLVDFSGALSAAASVGASHARGWRGINL